MGRNKLIAIIGVIIIAVAAGVGFFVYQKQFAAPQKTAETERFIVTIGKDDTGEITKQLLAQGFIKSELGFRVALFGPKGVKATIICLDCISAGAYKISKAMNVWEIAKILQQEPYMKWVTIPEGLRATQIAEKLQKELGWSNKTEGEFLVEASEGYLFPDTYLLSLDSSGADIAKRMKNQFNEKTADLFKQADEANIRNDTLIVLASLVQREAASEEEMPLIAGVIWNRWLKDMPFQIDATIQYALGEPGNWWPIVKPADYKLDSLYNTYIHKGRPPSPICNPGLAAIDAVVNSQDSEYLYYLHDSQGQIHLAKTYEEHLANIEKYLK